MTVMHAPSVNFAVSTIRTVHPVATAPLPFLQIGAHHPSLLVYLRECGNREATPPQP